jgi:hypothetical protein
VRTSTGGGLTPFVELVDMSGFDSDDDLKSSRLPTPYVVRAAMYVFLRCDMRQLMFVYNPMYALKMNCTLPRYESPLYYTPPQKSGQDFAPAQVENAIMRRFY